MQRLVIDARFAHLPTGLGRYTCELVRALLQLEDPAFSVHLLILPQAESWAATLPGRPTVHQITAAHYSLREQWEVPPLLRRIGADLFFVPHFNVPLLTTIPFVCTIHDLILHRYPNQSSLLRRFAYRLLFGSAVARARRIIAVSRFTEQELRSVYGERVASRIAVIGEGVSTVFRPLSEESYRPVLQRCGIHGRFFLYVGNAKEHKNVPLLLQAFVQAELSQTLLVLVATGSEAAQLSMPAHVLRIPRASDEELTALYSAATACVTASLYEGYGLPLVEAAACGCPIIATDVGALPEIAPVGARLVAPTLPALIDAFRSPPPRGLPPSSARWIDVAQAVQDTLRRACSAR